MNEQEKKAYNYLEKYIEWETLGERNLEGDIKTILDLIEKQQKQIEQMKTKINKTLLMIKENYNSDFYDDYETIAGLRDDIYNLLTKKYNVGE